MTKEEIDLEIIKTKAAVYDEIAFQEGHQKLIVESQKRVQELNGNLAKLFEESKSLEVQDDSKS